MHCSPTKPSYQSRQNHGRHAPPLFQAGPSAIRPHGTSSVISQQMDCASPDDVVKRVRLRFRSRRGEIFRIVMQQSAITPEAAVSAPPAELAQSGEGDFESGLPQPRASTSKSCKNSELPTIARVPDQPFSQTQTPSCETAGQLYCSERGV